MNAPFSENRRRLLQGKGFFAERAVSRNRRSPDGTYRRSPGQRGLRCDRRSAATHPVHANSGQGSVGCGQVISTRVACALAGLRRSARGALTTHLADGDRETCSESSSA